MAVEAEHRLRRVDVAARDGGDVGQPEEAVVDTEIDGAKALLGGELAADPQADRSGPACTMPDGAIAFCACRLCRMACWSRPSPATCWVEKLR